MSSVRVPQNMSLCRSEQSDPHTEITEQKHHRAALFTAATPHLLSLFPTRPEILWDLSLNYYYYKSVQVIDMFSCHTSNVYGIYVV